MRVYSAVQKPLYYQRVMPVQSALAFSPPQNIVQPISASQNVLLTFGKVIKNNEPHFVWPEYPLLVTDLAEKVATPRLITEYDPVGNDPKSVRRILPMDKAQQFYPNIQKITFKSANPIYDESMVSSIYKLWKNPDKKWGPYLKIQGYWLKNNEMPNKVIVMGHGWAGSASTLIELASELVKHNAHILMFDFRGHGKSQGTFTTVGYNESFDVAAAVREAKKTYPDLPVFYYGHSMGAVAAMNAPESIGNTKYHKIYRQMLDDLKGGGLLLDAPFNNVEFTYQFRDMIDNIIVKTAHSLGIIDDPDTLGPHFREVLLQNEKFKALKAKQFNWLSLDMKTQIAQKLLLRLMDNTDNFSENLAHDIDRRLTEMFHVSCRGQKAQCLSDIKPAKNMAQEGNILNLNMLLTHGDADKTTKSYHQDKHLRNHILEARQNFNNGKSDNEIGLLEVKLWEGVGHQNNAWQIPDDPEGKYYVSVLRGPLVNDINEFCDKVRHKTQALVSV